MSLRVILRPEAAAELTEAKAWYQNRLDGLGDRFAAAVVVAIEGVVAAPRAFPKVRGEIRRVLVSSFPYALYYQLIERDVVVLAIMHGRRRPREWDVRL